MLKRLTMATWLLACAIAPTTSTARKTLRVYHIGNSVTDTINYKGLKALAAQQGDEYIFGRHMMPGTPLVGLWDNQDKGFTEQPFGASIHALKAFDWDVITLQPYDRLLEGDRESEFESCSRFIEIALARNPGLQIYIYQRWPKRPIIGKPKYDGTDKCERIDYAARWKQAYSGKWGNTIETHDFFEKLTGRLNSAFGERLRHPVRVIPVGDVMAKFDEAIIRGETSAITSVNDIYVDNVHLNETGQYLVGLTFYATMFDADVSEIGTQGYQGIDPNVASVIRKCVTEVCGRTTDAERK
jgi:hypothetical protein